MTYPAYRHLLAGQPTSVCPARPSSGLVQASGRWLDSATSVWAWRWPRRPFRRRRPPRTAVALRAAGTPPGGIAAGLVEAVEDGAPRSGVPDGRGGLHDRQAVDPVVERIFEGADGSRRNCGRSPSSSRCRRRCRRRGTDGWGCSRGRRDLLVEGPDGRRAPADDSTRTNARRGSRTASSRGGTTTSGSTRCRASACAIAARSWDG